jgi:hypothetical protein
MSMLNVGEIQFQSHTAMVKQLWGIGWSLAIWKGGERVKEI